MDQEIKSNTSPAIKSGWLRGILFLISSLIVSTITSALGLLFIIISFKNEFDLTLMLEEPSEIMELFGPINMIVITFSQFLGMFLVLWLFRKFIDKKSIKSLGFELKNPSGLRQITCIITLSMSNKIKIKKTASLSLCTAYT